jgi:hypothetical protein
VPGSPVDNERSVGSSRGSRARLATLREGLRWQAKNGHCGSHDHGGAWRRNARGRLNRLDLGLIRKHWDSTVTHPEIGHIPLGMVGHFKQTVGEKKYVQPLAIKSKSGLEYRLWMYRMIEEYAFAGILKGPVFRRERKRGSDQVEQARVGDINVILHLALMRVQASRPHIISVETKVEEEYSASRSFKQGATAQARNMEIPTDVIQANNRWRQQERARGSTPNQSLLERYTDARASVPLLVKFSAGL